jgi:hypothetical protein
MMDVSHQGAHVPRIRWIVPPGNNSDVPGEWMNRSTYPLTQVHSPRHHDLDSDGFFCDIAMLTVHDDVCVRVLDQAFPSVRRSSEPSRRRLRQTLSTRRNLGFAHRPVEVIGAAGLSRATPDLTEAITAVFVGDECLSLCRHVFETPDMSTSKMFGPDVMAPPPSLRIAASAAN